MGRLFSSKKRLSDSSASRLAEKEQGRPAGWPAEVSYAQEGPTHTGETRTAPARRLPATAVGCHPAACHGVGSGATRTATRLGPKDYAVFPLSRDTHKLQLFIYPTSLAYHRVPRPARGVPRTDGAAPACPLTSPALATTGLPDPTRLAACPAPKPPRRRADRRQGVFRPTGSRPLPERLTSKRSTAGTPKAKAPHKAAGIRQPFPEKG